MAKEFYGYFDSLEGDMREYSADEFVAAFRALGGTGVGQGLAVEAAGGMRVRITPGGGLIYGYTYAMSDDGGGTKEFTLSSSGGADRFDRIVIQLNLTARNITMGVKVGTPGSQPVPPALTRTGTVREISLARIRVRASTNTILQTDIIDERPDAEVCGIAAPELLQLNNLDARYLIADSDKQKLAAIGVTDEVVSFGGRKLEGMVLPYGESTLPIALGAAERAVAGLAADDADREIHVYTHTYDSVNRVHKLTTADGKNYANGRVKAVIGFTPGDTFAVNGVGALAYSGTEQVDELPQGRWLTFVFAEGVINFKSGGAGARMKVIAVSSRSALPSAAREGTIAVVTGITLGKVSLGWGYHFDIIFGAQPAASGDLRFFVTGRGGVQSKIGKDAAVGLYRLEQYTGGEWVPRQFYVFDNGAWQTGRITLLHYFEGYADLHTELVQGGTLGYGLVGLRMESTTSTTNMLPFLGPLSLTDVDYIKAEVVILEGGFFLGVATLTEQGPYVENTTTSQQPVILTLDVRELTGEYAIFFGVSVPNVVASLEVISMWME